MTSRGRSLRARRRRDPPPSAADQEGALKEIQQRYHAAGLTGIDRQGFAPDAYLDTAESFYRDSKALIERWLDAVRRGAASNTPLGLELARCGQLIKGYGSTNERGKDNLLHIIDHLAQPDRADAAQAVAQARQAALSDEAGQALDQALVRHGAPARPLKAQPIRWHHNPRLKTRTP